MEPRRPALRFGEAGECLAQSRRWQEATVEDLGEPFDFGICQLDSSNNTLLAFPAQPLDSRTTKSLDIPTASRLDPTAGFGLPNHPGREIGELAQEVGPLALTQAETPSQVSKLFVKGYGGLGLETRHGRDPLASE